jgi:hypothetical protein
VWRDVAHYLDPDQRLSFVVLISEDGTIEYRYKDVAGTGLEAGNSATIGLENAAGTVAYLYSDSEPVVSDGLAIAFHTTRTGVVRGTVTDATDGRALGGATVTVRAGGQVIATTVSDPGGAYLAQVGAGAVTVEVASPRYETATTAVTVAVGAVATANIALRTARVAASPGSLEIVAAAGGSRTRTVDLTNTGALPATYSLAEATADGPADVPWLAVLGGGGTLSPGQHASVLLTVSTAGLAPGTHQTAYLQITSNSGRLPVLDVPIHLVVPGFQAALDAGSAHGHVDLLGDAWQPDAAQKPGGCGYLGASSVISTRKRITGTTDETRLADARQGMYEYRCDGVPAGVYTVELDFAELKAAKPNTRVFDVLLEGALVLPSLDIALEAGSFTAVSRRYEVRVTDGQLNLRFVTHTGFGKPLVNGVRFTQRPDL